MSMRVTKKGTRCMGVGVGVKAGVVGKGVGVCRGTTTVTVFFGAGLGVGVVDGNALDAHAVISNATITSKQYSVFLIVIPMPHYIGHFHNKNKGDNNKFN